MSHLPKARAFRLLSQALQQWHLDCNAGSSLFAPLFPLFHHQSLEHDKECLLSSIRGSSETTAAFCVYLQIYIRKLVV